MGVCMCMCARVCRHDPHEELNCLYLPYT